MKPQAINIPARSSYPSRSHICAVAALMFYALSAQAQTDQILPATGGPGGGQYTARCAADQILTGFDLRTGDDVDAIQPLCMAVRGPSQAGPIYPYPAKFGGDGGGVRRLICPDNAPLVVGMAIAAEGVKTVIVNNIHLFCGPALANQVPAANPTVIFDGPPAQYSDAIFFQSGNMVQHYDSEGPQACPGGLVAVGISGRSGKWLDAVGLVCGAPPAMAQAVPANITPGNVGKPPVTLGRKGTTPSPTMQRADSHTLIDAMATTKVRPQQGAQSGAAAALNPQPLPPKSSNGTQRDAAPNAAKGSETSIIIVSGKSDVPVQKRTHFGKTTVLPIKHKAPGQGAPIGH